jgi:hypothetical protein
MRSQMRFISLLLTACCALAVPACMREVAPGKVAEPARGVPETRRVASSNAVVSSAPQTAANGGIFSKAPARLPSTDPVAPGGIFSKVPARPPLD